MNLEEIARLAGVSRSTVSRVVNGDPRVSDAVRERVQGIVRAHDYHPNAAARSLASRRTRILGLLIPQSVATIFGDPYFPTLIQGMAEVCNVADHNLMLVMDPSGEPASADRLYRRVVHGRHLDGLIITSSEVDDPIVARVQRDTFPCVLVGRHPRHELSSVDVDNRTGARRAVTHLASHGRRRIALVGGPPNMIAAVDRAAGYAAALDDAGLQHDLDLTVAADFTRSGGYRAMQRLLVLAHPP